MHILPLDLTTNQNTLNMYDKNHIIQLQPQVH
jgi:hypothetical protein